MTSSPSTSEFTRDDNPFIKNIYPQSSSKFNFKSNLPLSNKCYNFFNDSNSLGINDRSQEEQNKFPKNILEEITTKRPFSNFNCGGSLPKKVEIRQNNNINKIILDNLAEKDKKKSRMLSVESNLLSPNYHNGNLILKRNIYKIKK